MIAMYDFSINEFTTTRCRLKIQDITLLRVDTFNFVRGDVILTQPMTDVFKARETVYEKQL